jgi:MYXO-CTERM domain-containing protein
VFNGWVTKRKTIIFGRKSVFTKNQMKIVAAIAAGTVGTITASTASADAVLTYGFTDMSGAFVRDNPGPGGQFTARAVDNAVLRTAGDVSRIVAPFGTAVYDDGFVSGLDPADVVLTISVFNVLGGPIPTAEGVGDFTITDVDGDTIHGTVSGTWLLLAGGVYFNGDLSGVAITSDDGTFDGPAGGSVQTSDLGILEGANTVLFTNPIGGWWDQSFRDVSTQFSGELLPTPGAMALLGLGGLVATRRRR